MNHRTIHAATLTITDRFGHGTVVRVSWRSEDVTWADPASANAGRRITAWDGPDECPVILTEPHPGLIVARPRHITVNGTDITASEKQAGEALEPGTYRCETIR
ncbi:hypothetical protein [Bifidobacterium simiarum]|uniref:hypothetical protein n=1 Tax=Bifidobacterium simiarum TaxID=2045441 RepID=UPI001BDBE8E9|nr:hypothetical protein [Bifidobacterium simiarum]MBT1167272.1 hypothetical protein [Bifidobacterium simiarum]